MTAPLPIHRNQSIYYIDMLEVVSIKRFRTTICFTANIVWPGWSIIIVGIRRYFTNIFPLCKDKSEDNKEVIITSTFTTIKQIIYTLITSWRRTCKMMHPYFALTERNWTSPIVYIYIWKCSLLTWTTAKKWKNYSNTPNNTIGISPLIGQKKTHLTTQF